MERHKVGAFPVVDEEGRLKGIISVRDLMRAFVSVLGLKTPGVLIGIVVEDKLGQMKKIVDAISELGISFGSVLVARVWEEGKERFSLTFSPITLSGLKNISWRRALRCSTPWNGTSTGSRARNTSPGSRIFSGCGLSRRVRLPRANPSGI